MKPGNEYASLRAADYGKKRRDGQQIDIGSQITFKQKAVLAAKKVKHRILM